MSAVTTAELVRGVALLSWAAGLFEGEGTVSITNSGRRGYTRPLVALTSVDPETIAVLQSRWPGRVRAYQPKGNARVAMTWHLDARLPIIRFLSDIQPFVRRPAVREKIAIVIDDIAAREQGARRPGYLDDCRERRERIRVLNKRGTA